MRICTVFGSLDLKRWLEKSDAEEFLRMNGAPVNVVSLASHGGSWSTLLREGAGRQPGVGLLFEADHHGIEPQLLLTPRQILLGVGGHVCAVQPPDWQVAWAHELDGPFYRFLCVPTDDTFLVVHEVGVEKLDANGRVAWSWASFEIVSGVEFDGETLEIRGYDGTQTSLDPATGRVIGTPSI